jgi:hypothetical protein
VVAIVIERLAMNKQRSQIFHMERFNLKKLNEVGGKEHVRWDPCPHSMARPRVADGGTASRYGG